MARGKKRKTPASRAAVNGNIILELNFDQLSRLEKYFLFFIIDDDNNLNKVLRQSQVDFDQAEELRRQEEEDLQKAIKESLRPSSSIKTENIGEDHPLLVPEVPVNATESGQVFF